MTLPTTDLLLGPHTTPTLSAARIAELVDQPAPTDEQRRIIEAPLAPSLVVAGAGSGKTETMAARVVWLLANGVVQPDQVLGLTFTRKAAGELAERVRKRLRTLSRAAAAQGVALAETAGGDALSGLARPTISTYNSYAASLVTDHALRLGLDPSARLLGEAAQWQLASDVVEAWSGDLDTDAATSTVIEAVLTLSGALDEHLLDPAAARGGIEDIVDGLLATPSGTPPREPYAEIKKLVRSLGERVRVLELVAEYRQRKRAADAIDFGDQVALAARLALDVPEVGVAERTRFRVVLLDEYQDTSYAQLTLLGALFGEGHPVTAVGDPHQSIYGWRGASAGGLEGFPTQFPQVHADGSRNPADVHQLSTSWRNDSRILAAANHVAGPLRAASTRVEVPVLAARPGAGEGRVHGFVAATVEDEATAVASFVAERWRPAVDGSARVSAAVLCRKRSQFEPLRRALRARGLPVEVVGLGGLLSAPEVVDLVAVLQAAHDPSRGDALMRLLTGARTALGAADLHALAAWAGELAARHTGTSRVPTDRVEAIPGARAAAPGDACDVGVAPLVEADAVDERSIVDALDAIGELPAAGWTSRSGRTLSATGRARLLDLAALLRVVRSHTYLSVPELVGEAERLLGLDIEVAARAGTTPGRARAQLDAFRDVAGEFARSADHPNLGGFLAWLEAAEAKEHGLDMPVAEPDPDAVQLITVHAAKGLEWDLVAVAGLVDGGLPATATQGKEGPKDSAWLTGLGSLPYPLRGDRHDLPEFAYGGAADPKDLEERRKDFVFRAGDHQVAEERRLAYVALTRARTHLFLTAAWWGDGSRARKVSTFLHELAEAGLVELDAWEPAPADGEENPRAALVLAASWPADPFGTDGASTRRAHVESAAHRVRAAIHRTAEQGAVGGAEAHPWELLATRLLAEQERVRTPSAVVELPAHLSASALVRLENDPAEFARHLRRPVPAEPSPQARRGTRFHAWVESWYGSAALVDVDALPGADDDTAATDLDEEALREAFQSTEWADRSPIAIEVDVETPVDGYVLRSRIDAVFTDPARRDGVVVVDWKTGAPPTDAASRAAREVQLAVYRLAWSRWTGVPLDRVRAAFCYVGSATTVYPERLLDEVEITALLRAATAREAMPEPRPVRPAGAGTNRAGSRDNSPARTRSGWAGQKARRAPDQMTLDLDGLADEAPAER
ncbi:ATP-dependent DNA helicase [Cellulomonas sp. URHD0024]|uniref:ATP-dependent DNA helicase n=1 Tax=Cellulomonas sp. URHD0024 TaxID=1302620 RepID=UPI0004257019|nr:ATP-dependent DNA helicase [Cellulomonas sp. URHD0024]